jgi:hypothetical protein
VILGRSVLEQHGAYVNDDVTQKPVQSLLSQVIEGLDELDNENHLVYNCARFIARLSQPQSDKG